MNISTDFIDDLFSNQYFKSRFESFLSSLGTGISTDKTSVIEQITETLSQNCKLTMQKQYHHVYQSNRQLIEQIETIKNKLQFSSRLKTESSTAERDTKSKLSTSILFDNDDQYEFREVSKNVDYFQDEIENKVLVNSFEMEQQNHSLIDQDIQDKINASIEGNINRIELSLEEKFQKYSLKVEQRIEQLRKTIASLVEAMNEKQLWNRTQTSNIQSSLNNITSLNAFTKKQPKPTKKQQNPTNHQQYPLTLIDQDCQSTNFERQKTQHQQLNTSNKAMESLNKSINVGRTKIKSLFGFKTSSKKQKQQQKSQI